MALRRMAEYFSRRVVFRRRLPREVGGATIYVTPAASLSYWIRPMERIDPMLLQFVRDHVRPGSTVWDVGANVGLFGFAAAGVAGPEGSVLALEADDWLAALVRRSAQLNAGTMAAVSVLGVAVSDRVGVAQFAIARRGRASNFLREAEGSSQAGGVRETRLAMTVTLDWLLERFKPPDVIKIDVEGAEHLVLAGAARLLQSVRPIILCEVAPRNRAPLARLFREAEYTLYPATPGASAPSIVQPVANTLAIPADAATGLGGQT